MIALIEAALHRSRTVLTIFVMLLISGWITYLGIPKEANPDVPIPYIYISIPHEGISPEDGERMLLRPMEQQLRTLEGIKKMESTASEGHASVTIEFQAGMDNKQVLADVRERVSIATSKLPAETEEPTVSEITMAEQNPVVTLMLAGSVPERTLSMIARDMRDRLEGFREILEVKIRGAREDMLEIIVDPLLMESYDLAPAEIFQLVSRNNSLVAAGTLDTGSGRFAIKVPGIIENLNDILEMPIKTSGDKVVMFKDVASLRRTYKDANGFARLDGYPSLALEVIKRPGENSISTVEKVKELTEEVKSFWPNGVTVTYTGDSSRDVKNMLNELSNSVLSAVILVVIVIMGILGFRTAALVGIAIPGSFLMGILALSMGGITINIVVLFALIMAVGMLVDGAIVVTEYADRKMSEGVEKYQAYREASIRMAWPIIASTATTLAAFMPLIFWPGIMGEFMKYLPLTLIATLTASLLMALIFVPTLGAVFGAPRYVSSSARASMLNAETGDLDKVIGFTGFYIKLLRKSLKSPFLMLCSAVMISIAIGAAYAQFGKGTEYFPNVEPSGANLVIRARGDLSIYEKDALVKEVESLLFDLGEVETLYTRTSGSGDTIGRLRLNFHNWDVRREADAIIKTIRQRTEHLAGIEIQIRKDDNGPGSGGKPLDIQLSSRFPELLDETAKIIREEMSQIDGLIDIEDSRPLPGIEWRVEVDRAQAARYGADVTTVGNAVQLVTNGLKLTEFRPDDADDEVDIRVRYPHRSRHIEQLDHLRVRTSRGLVPVSNFITRSAVQKVDTIRRLDSRRIMHVRADLKPDVLLSDKLKELESRYKAIDIDPRVQIKVAGENQEQAESMAFLMNAFMVALVVMAIILITQFNSFYQAFLILSAVMFSTAGVFLGLLIMNKPFGVVMSGIGVISLAGIVVNNNIVLIDTYNVLRREGYEAMEAIIRTGAQRLRPVLLTTVTTILGLMPMVLALNIDLIKQTVSVGAPSTQWWTQLSSAVAGGLTFATVLTLVITPCMLMIGVRVSERFKQWRSRRADSKVSVGDDRISPDSV